METYNISDYPGNCFSQMSSSARTSTRIFMHILWQDKRQIPWRKSRGLNKENKIWKLKRAIQIMFDDFLYNVCFIIVKTVYLNFLKLFCLVVAVASLFPKFIITKRLPQWHNDRSKNLTKILLKSSCHGSVVRSIDFFYPVQAITPVGFYHQ